MQGWPERPHHRRRRVGLVLLLAGMAAGCGLAPYEEQMARTRERLAYLDRENELLGDPLPWPADRIPRVFLRPPRGLAGQPSPDASPAPDWLFAFEPADNKTVVPPFGLLVGAHVRPSHPAELDEQLRKDLRKHAEDVRVQSEPASARELVCVRECDPPGAVHAVRYRRFSLQADEYPRWPGGRRASISAPCVYRYEVNLHEAGDWVIVVMFKQLDREATEKLWREKEVEASEIRRLPLVDRERLNRQKRYCLATLRVGAAAAERWRRQGAGT